MRFNDKSTRKGNPPGDQKRSRVRFWSPLVSLALAPLVLLAAPGSASATTWCFYEGGGHPDVKGSTTWAETTQQARNTWQDWVWRGPTFRCPTNVPSCSYAWGQSKTVSWYWEAGLSVTLGPVNIVPNYGRTSSTTTVYTFTTTLSPGQYAQPISIVDRRWKSGDFVGAFRSNGTVCDYHHPTVFQYYWDGNYRWGSWSQNERVDDYGTYNVWS